MTDPAQSMQDWVTGGAGEGEPALSVTQIREAIDDRVASYAAFFTDAADLPATATSRANGVFYDPLDMEEYLEGGALLIRDGDGDFVVNPLVCVVSRYDADFDDWIYEVWIDEGYEEA